MTAREAIERGIRLVRVPQWNEFAYIELPPRNEDDTHGPWAKLYDPISACVLQDHPEGVSLDLRKFPIYLLFTVWDDDSDDLVEFTGPRFTPDDIRAGKHIQRLEMKS